MGSAHIYHPTYLPPYSHQYSSHPETDIEYAGFSLGEYTALVAANKISLKSALELVMVRANLMQVDCEKVDSKMATVVIKGGKNIKLPLKDLLLDLITEDEVLSITGYLGMFMV